MSEKQTAVIKPFAATANLRPQIKDVFTLQ